MSDVGVQISDIFAAVTAAEQQAPAAVKQHSLDKIVGRRSTEKGQLKTSKAAMTAVEQPTAPAAAWKAANSKLSQEVRLQQLRLEVLQGRKQLPGDSSCSMKGKMRQSGTGTYPKCYLGM